MHIASLCRVRSATMDITCHPSSSFMLGRHRCLTVDPHVMVLLVTFPGHTGLTQGTP